MLHLPLSVMNRPKPSLLFSNIRCCISKRISFLDFLMGLVSLEVSWLIFMPLRPPKTMKDSYMTLFLYFSAYTLAKLYEVEGDISEIAR